MHEIQAYSVFFTCDSMLSATLLAIVNLSVRFVFHICLFVPSHAERMSIRLDFLTQFCRWTKNVDFSRKTDD